MMGRFFYIGKIILKFVILKATETGLHEINLKKNSATAIILLNLRFIIYTQ
jgi:hypothetical protein